MKPDIGLKTEIIGRHATWLELFYDLIYVVVIAKLAHMMAHMHDGHLDWHHTMHSVALFIPVWWCWVGHTMFANRFDSDDVIQRILTLLQMFGAVIMAVFIEKALGEGGVGFILSYILIRVLLIVMYIRVYKVSKDLQYITRLFTIGFSLGVSFWIASLFVEGTLRYIFWGFGLLIDFATPWVGQKKLSKVSVHKDHLPERLGLLTIIILGESVLGIVSGISGIEWGIGELFNLMAGFSLLCGIWWLYFETLEHVLAGKELRSGQLSIYGHLPIYIGMAILSAGLLHNITAKISVFESSLLLIIGLLMILIPLHIIQIIQTPKVNRKRLYFGIMFLYAVNILIFFIHNLIAYNLLLCMFALNIIFFLIWQHREKTS